MNRSVIRPFLSLAVLAGVLGQAVPARAQTAGAIRKFTGYNANWLSGTQLGSDFSYGVTLPFTINLFGTTTNQMYVGENGYVTSAFWGTPKGATQPTINWDPVDPFSSWNHDFAILAPFFMNHHTDYVDLTGDGSPTETPAGVTYGSGTLEDGRSAFAVNWEKVISRLNADGTVMPENNFQLVLIDMGGGNFEMEFNYGSMLNDWHDSHTPHGTASQAGARVGYAQARAATTPGASIWEHAQSSTEYALLDPTHDYDPYRGIDYQDQYSLSTHSANSTTTGRYMFEMPPSTTSTGTTTTSTVPEPASLLLLGSGLAGLGAVRRRRRREPALS